MNSHEIWCIQVNDSVYEANFEEVVEWINEGAILSEDKVKRGNLRWIRADKVPELYEYFHAKNLGAEFSDSVFDSNLNSNEVYTNFQVENVEKSTERSGSFAQSSANFSESAASLISVKEVPAAEQSSFEIIVCSVHPELEPVYICEICNVLFCKTCPHSFGSSVKLCLDCGGLCIAYTGQIKNADKMRGSMNKPYRRNEKSENRLSQIDASLKLKDLLNALKYPFNFPVSLLIGLTLLILLMLGASLTIFGGKFLLFAAAGFGLAAIMLTFCVLAKIVENFSQKKFNNDFLPKLNKYNFWEDVIYPSFLSIAVYLVSFGLFLTVLSGATFYTWYKFSNESDSVESNMRQADQHIKIIIENARSNTESLKKNQILQTPTDNNGTKANPPDLEQMIEKTKDKNFESMFGTNHLGDNREIIKFIKSSIRISSPFQMPLLFAFIFGLFYFPAAGSIAGSTRS